MKNSIPSSGGMCWRYMRPRAWAASLRATSTDTAFSPDGVAR
jgi:hypothetical protein